MHISKILQAGNVPRVCNATNQLTKDLCIYKLSLITITNLITGSRCIYMLSQFSNKQENKSPSSFFIKWSKSNMEEQDEII